MQKESSELHCSFCGKSQHAVATLVQAPSALICDECVGVCIEILGANKEWCQREIANLQRPAHDVMERGLTSKAVRVARHTKK